MKNRFKIIELPKHQVLIMKAWTEDRTEDPTLELTFFHEGLKISHTLGYKTELRRDEMFDEMTIERVLPVVMKTITFLNKNTESKSKKKKK